MEGHVVLVVVSSSGACDEEWWSCFGDFLFNFLVVVKDGDDKSFWLLGSGGLWLPAMIVWDCLKEGLRVGNKERNSEKGPMSVVNTPGGFDTFLNMLTPFSSIKDSVKTMGVEIIENNYFMLSLVHLKDVIDLRVVVWILWPDEERSSNPNLEKVNALADMELSRIGVDMGGCIQSCYMLGKKLDMAYSLLEMMILHLPSPCTAKKYHVENVYEGPSDDVYANAIRKCETRDLNVRSVQRTLVWLGQRQVFSSFGPVLKIAMFDKNGGVQALIQYPDVKTIMVSKEALEGHCIYDGGRDYTMPAAVQMNPQPSILGQQPPYVSPQYNPVQYMPSPEGYVVPPVAGDFLGSLGKELGLEVPPDQPYVEKHCGCWSGYSYCKDGYFGDESAEVVISSLRLGDDQGSLFTNSNWFAFQDNIEDNAPNSATSASAMLDEVNLNGTSHGGNSSSDNEVVVGEDEELVTCNGTSTSDPNPFIQENKETDGDLRMVENPDAT
ncbi:structural maintenance of chromosomes protein 1 [Tanacetum coccineum]